MTLPYKSVSGFSGVKILYYLRCGTYGLTSHRQSGFFTLPPHLRSSSAQPPSSCFLHLQYVSPHIAYMKSSPHAWRRHGTRYEQCDTFMTYTHPPHHRNNGGYGLRCADWYEKEGNVSRHRPLGISNIWKKKLTITMFKY